MTCSGQAKTQTAKHMQYFETIPIIPKSVFEHAQDKTFSLYHSISLTVFFFFPRLSLLCLCLASVLSLCVRLINLAIFLNKVPWPSPQLILGTEHAGSQVAARRTASEPAVIVSMCFAGCADVHFGVFRVTDSQAANGICGKTMKWYNCLIKHTDTVAKGWQLYTTT